MIGLADAPKVAIPSGSYRNLEQYTAVVPQVYRAKTEFAAVYDKPMHVLSFLRPILTGSDTRYAGARRRVSDFTERRESLIGLVKRFARSGHMARFDRSPTTITSDTAEAAVALLKLLPPSTHLPQIVPDAEGGLIIAWEHIAEPVLLTVDGWTLYLVAAAATPHARYFDSVPFDGQTLPAKIAEELPKK